MVIIYKIITYLIDLMISLKAKNIKWTLPLFLKSLNIQVLLSFRHLQQFYNHNSGYTSSHQC